MIESPQGKGTGFFLNEEGLLVTALHCLPKGRTDGVKIIFEGESYEVLFPHSLDENAARQLDLCLLQISSEKKPKVTPLSPLPTSFIMKEGMRIYFAGFPLTQTSLTFHQGYISSIFNKDGVQYFTVDGTVVPGNSGGPVVIQHEGNLYLAGVVFSEVADIDSLFFKNVEKLKPKLEKATMHIGSVKFNEIISQLISTTFSNLSTGIGKVIHVASLSNLFKDRDTKIPLLNRSSEGEFPVIKKTKIEKTLKEHGWYLEREGGNHEIWTNGQGQKESLGRHSEIPNGTALKIINTAKNHPGEKKEEKKG